MQFHRITTINDPALTFIKKIYEDAFPAHERREWSRLLELIPLQDEMHLDLLHTDDGHIGLLIWWQIETAYYIEHFAIDAALRGKSYGAAVLNYYKDLLPGKIILEVEPPETTDAVRRISFYERLGYRVLDVDYRQPSYTDPDGSFSMLLMSNVPFQDGEGQILAEQIKNKVYHSLRA